MSRYYSIVITNQGGTVITPPGAAGGTDSTYSSYVRGQVQPNALDMEMDVQLASFDTPAGSGDTGSLIRVWGISLAEIKQSFNLNNNLIKVYGGFQKGLPLANPAQAGLLFSGYVQQAYGNWIETDMTLDLVVQAGTGPTGNNNTGTRGTPANLVLNWQKGQNLKDALQQTLSTAFPGKTVNINISSNLVFKSENLTGFYATLGEFASVVQSLSRTVVNQKGYAGVKIVFDQGTIKVTDGTTSLTPKQITFKDLIGQPTWLGVNTIQIKCPMRADIKTLDFVSLPQAQFTTTPQSQSQFRNNSGFTGSWFVTSLRHVGRFRQSSADSWVTVMELAQTVQ
jgi:hypothetical protein